MEQFPSGLPEFSPTPEKTGESKDGKNKKKRTARLSKGVLAELTGKEAEASRPKKRTKVPRGVLELETAQDQAPTSEDTEKDKKADSVEVSEDQTAATDKSEAKEPSVEQTDTPDIETTAPSIFDNFEEHIYSRTESAEGESDKEPVSHTESLPLSSEEAPEQAGGKKSPENPVSPPASEASNPKASAESTSGAPTEAVSTPVFYEDIPSATPVVERLRMIDPRETTPADNAAEHYRAATVEPGISKAEHDAELYRVRKQATRKGVGAGLVAGWWAGSRGKKEAVKKAEKAEAEVKKQSKEMKRLEGEQAVIAERLRTLANTHEQLPPVLSNSETARSLPVVESLPAGVAAAAVEARIENSTEATKLLKAEALDKSEKAKPKPELSPEDQPISEETYKTAPGRRIETSAWHTIEVDEKTGQAVANPERGYGREFRHEQQQERLHQLAHKQQAAVPLGHLASQAAPAYADDRSDSRSVLAPEFEDVVKEAKAHKVNATYIRQQLIRRTTRPATWVIALVIVVLLFLALSR